MQNLNIMISPLEWGLLASVVVALTLSCMAWCRAGRILQLIDDSPLSEINLYEEPAVQEVDERAEVSLDLVVYKNEYDQVILKLSNTGMLVSRKIHITIDEPDNVFNAESMIEGSESGALAVSSAISPRLSVLDADNKLPITEISSGDTLEVVAVLTMSHGKVCDFPASLKWVDGNGAVQEKRVKLTI